MALHISLTATTPVTPGVVATLNPGDSLSVSRDAADRSDWGSFHAAIVTAWTRGADVHLDSRKGQGSG